MIYRPPTMRYCPFESLSCGIGVYPSGLGYIDRRWFPLELNRLGIVNFVGLGDLLFILIHNAKKFCYIYVFVYMYACLYICVCVYVCMLM